MRIAYFYFTTVSRCFTVVLIFLSRKSGKEGGFITYFECGYWLFLETLYHIQCLFSVF